MSDSTRDFFETLANVLRPCWLFGFALLIIWFVAALVAGDVIHQLHGPMFGLTGHELDVIFYCGMGLLKLFVFIFFFIPWLAIKLELKKG